MNQYLENTRLAGIVQMVLGGLTCLCGCFPMIHVFMGLMLASGVMPQSNTGNSQPMPREFELMMGGIFTFAGVLTICFFWLMGFMIIYSGVCLRQTKYYTFCLAASSVMCALFPFGTVAGVMTLLLLVKPEVKQLFQNRGQA